MPALGEAPRARESEFAGGPNVRQRPCPMLSNATDSDLGRLVEEAAGLEPVAEEIRRLAGSLPPERAREALRHAFDTREVDGATTLALVLLAHGTPAAAEAVERIFPDAIDDRAGQVLVAAHPERLAILERLLGSRRLDRFQLASAAALYTHLHPEPPWPSVLIETLRTLARARPGWVGESYARQAALRITDPHLDGLYGIDRAKEKSEDLFSDFGETPSLDALRATRSHVIASGFTARRATPKVGRNDVCPCGSGKKYKKCCAEKQRGEAWSPVAGITMREYRRHLHEYLEAGDLLKEHPADLARLPLESLHTDQLDACFQVFLDCERMDEAERALEELAKRELGDKVTIDDLRAELVTFAHDWGHDALVGRHLERFVDPQKVPRHVALGRELRHPTERTLSVLEEECRAHVIEGGPPPMEVAYELLEPYPALGIIMARGCLDAEYAKDSLTLLDEIEWARDRLGAPPDDAAWERWDLMAEERRLTKASEEEKQALRLELERMREEARDARAEAQVHVRELGKHREQLAKIEAKAAATAKKAAKTEKERAAQAADAEAARQHRLKIRELEERIREGQRERAELRQRAEEVAKHPAAIASGAGDEELEDEAGEEVTARGLRVPVWSAKARASIERLPHKVAAAAIATAGALGAGRPEAWRHAKRLEGMHGLCSARLGIHHRLLFRMDEEDTLDVDEVVTREDLDRALAARR